MNEQSLKNAVAAINQQNEFVLSARGRAKIAAAQLREVSHEMRNRKVNHGKHTSPTLCAWADRIDAIADKLEPRS